MDNTFSITSVTVDEAVWILLGRAPGPIRYKSRNEDPTEEELEVLASVEFCLQEELEEEIDATLSDYGEAKSDNSPSEVIAEKYEAFQKAKVQEIKARTYLCAIDDELNKGVFSELRIDRNMPGCITMISLDQWARNNYSISVLPSEYLPKNSLAGDAQPSTNAEADMAEKGDPGKRQEKIPKQRAQEQAILKALEQLGYDPKALPRFDSKRTDDKHWVKAKAWHALEGQPLFPKKESKGIFDKAWERLRCYKDIAEV